MAEFEADLDVLEAQFAGLEGSMSGLEIVTVAFRRELEGVQGSMKDAERQASGMSRTLSTSLRRAFDGVIFDGKKVTDALAGVGKSISGSVLNSALAPVQGAVGSMVGNGMKSILGGLVPFEKGGAFQSGRVVAFARGGIVEGPTHFLMREVIQFRNAVLDAPGIYRLSGLLRGQAGTDWVMPAQWPAGTEFVLLDGSATQIDFRAADRGLERHYRVGPAERPYDDASYVHSVHAFEAVGLRPYRPAHLEARQASSGEILLTWKRRTRIDGDSWSGADVPLGEDREIYNIRVLARASVLRSENSFDSRWAYTAAAQAADLAVAPLVFEVAQVSDRFGAGPYQRIVFDG